MRHRLAAKDRNGLADPEDVATELGIGLYEETSITTPHITHCDSTSG